MAAYAAFAPYIVNVHAPGRAGRLRLPIENYSFQYVHYIGFHRASMDVSFCPCIESGWRMDRRFWNRGYATEGAKASLEHGFRQLEFERYFDHPNLRPGDPLRPHVCCYREKGTT